MVSQRKISELQAFEIEMADDAGIGPKAAHELASRTVGGKLNFPECVMLVDNTLDILGKQIEDKINACTSTPRFPGTSVTDASPPNELLSNARLKKKEVETKTSKRRRSWLDKKHKIRKKRENQTTSHFGEEVCCSIKIMF
jgi:chromatin remodeling complex protein RSC6